MTLTLEDAPIDDRAPKRMSGARAVGLALLATLATFTCLPFLFDLDPAAQDLMRTLGEPGLAHPFGTDHLGRDMLARLSHGAWLSLSLATLCVAAAAIVSTALGLLAAWTGRWTDRVLSLVSDAILALPGLLLILLLAALAPGRPWAIALGIALTLGVEMFRFTRAIARERLSGPAVEASRLIGFGPLYILRRHVWPDLAPRLATLVVFAMATAVTALVTLGYIGSGFRPPTPEWGTMTAELLPYWREAPWLILQPVAALSLTLAALFLIVGKPE